MKLMKPLCPVCTMPAEGAIDIVPGVAYFEDSDDLSVREFSGYSKMWWEESKTSENEKGEIELVCPNGHDWFSAIEDNEVRSGVADVPEGGDPRSGGPRQ